MPTNILEGLGWNEYFQHHFELNYVKDAIPGRVVTEQRGSLMVSVVIWEYCRPKYPANFALMPSLQGDFRQ